MSDDDVEIESLKRAIWSLLDAEVDFNEQTSFDVNVTRRKEEFRRDPIVASGRTLVEAYKNLLRNVVRSTSGPMPRG